VVNVVAQDTFEDFRKKSQTELDDFKKKSEKEFKDFRDKANAEYAEFMRIAWEEFRSFTGIPVPPSPEPVTPPVVEPDKKPTDDPLPYGEVIPVPQPVRPPQPIQPIYPDPQPGKQTLKFLFFNIPCIVNLEPNQKISLPNLSENRIADAWRQLSGSAYNAVINDCLTLREQLKIGDWGYLLLLKSLSETQYHSTASNEAVLLQMYILIQSGYKIRIAKTNNRLVLLIPFQQIVYEYAYLRIDGVIYHVMDNSSEDDVFFVFDQEFPQEQVFSLQMHELPAFPVAETPPKTFSSEHYPALKVSVSTNRYLIDFYNSYPLTSNWNLYAQASLSETVKRSLYPVLRNQIIGKSEQEAANMLLHFVQFAFRYKTDEEQFGYERPLFADETFYYPFSDCEDRAILYSVLVRELLGLEVVLLHYPGHLATAVHFNEAVQGDYLMIDGRKFLVCDPTYIGAPVGVTMDEYKQVKAKVVKI
jgi:hypothetical protein